MRLLAATATLAALGASTAAAAPVTAKVTQYAIQTPDIGSCRLKGIDSGSDNFKFYASVSAKDVASINDGCARCIKVSKDGAAASLTAYVLDVCQGCKAGELKLSTAALSTLAIDANLNNATATYKFTSCPSAFQAGSSVKACLMEGASNTYIPLQFFNSHKVIASANISGIAATQQKDSFFFSATPQVSNANGNAQWFKDVQVTLTSSDGETQSGSFAFGGTTGCATSTFQFSAASTADGQDDDDAGGAGSGKGGGSTGVIIGAICGGIGALLIIVGSIVFVRRRRASKEFENARHDDPDQQYLSPTAKPHNPRSPERPTYAADTSLHNSTDDPSDHDMPDSPTVDFDDAATPAASAPGRNVYGAGRTDPYSAAPVPPQQQQPPQQAYQPQYAQQQQQQRQAAAAAAPRVAHQTYVTPTSYAFSKPVTNERAAGNKSFRGNTGSGRGAPTFPAPVLPKSRSHSASDDEDQEGRSSFDIDDLRETEELKSRERFSSLANDMHGVAPHSSESAYATGHVTSPQSYVRATTLRRASSKAAPERPTFRFTASAAKSEESLGSSGYSDRDSYASENYARGDSNLDSHGTANPNTGSLRDTAGYSRESLGILGYPYAKKPSGRNSITGTNHA